MARNDISDEEGTQTLISSPRRDFAWVSSDLSKGLIFTLPVDEGHGMLLGTWKATKYVCDAGFIGRGA